MVARIIMLAVPTNKLSTVKGRGGWQCPVLSNTGPKADAPFADVLENSPNK